MVNIAKRMRTLQPLFYIRHGHGAAVLPPSPAPQVTQLDLWLPEQKKAFESPEWKQTITEPWNFVRRTLPRIKYHNPALPIRVERSDNTMLGLTFESDDKTSLISLEPTKETTIPLYTLFKSSWSDVTSKSQPSAHGPAAQPPTTLYTRNVKVDISGKEAKLIWKWLKYTAKFQEVPLANEEEQQMMSQLREFNEQSRIDRHLVKAGIDAIRKEKEELRKAREAAERMTSDA